MKDHLLSRRAMLAAGGALLPAAALAQPVGPVTRMVVPFQAGISVDVLARALARQMAAGLGQPIVVDNRPGNTGHIGTATVARAAPDGQTLLLGASSTHVVSPQVLRNLPYRPVEDFAPIALIARIPIVLVVSSGLPVRSVAELVEHTRRARGEVTYSTYGVGGNMHLGSALLSQRTGIEMIHVPYTSGSPMPDLMAGRVTFMFENAVSAIPMVRDGRLRALAVASEDEVPGLPDLPRMSQTFPGFEVNAWGMLLAPRGIPAALHDRLEAEALRAMATPEMAEAYASLAMVPGRLGAADAEAFLRREWDKWTRIVAETGVRID